ncbi:hypothetical protein IHE44_0004283 [Lamprotornis superbus]|uniref:Uncharacterized protein n=1 Tax=Lamprotornis superbus TaxID=245042 RepID=A0A835NN13_9PASS|nr:hypothetical protein IHE44_0004283 [Lamprotornis superbus]
MQGTVLEVQRGAEGGSARLQDGSGAFTVLGVEQVPQGRPCLSAGKYVMVMGVVRSCSPEPVLRAIKMTDLSENPVHKNMWNLEVEDLHRNIGLFYVNTPGVNQSEGLGSVKCPGSGGVQLSPRGQRGFQLPCGSRENELAVYSVLALILQQSHTQSPPVVQPWPCAGGALLTKLEEPRFICTLFTGITISPPHARKTSSSGFEVASYRCLHLIRFGDRWQQAFENETPVSGCKTHTWPAESVAQPPQAVMSTLDLSSRPSQSLAKKEESERKKYKRALTESVKLKMLSKSGLNTCKRLEKPTLNAMTSRQLWEESSVKGDDATHIRIDSVPANLSNSCPLVLSQLLSFLQHEYIPLGVLKTPGFVLQELLDKKKCQVVRVQKENTIWKGSGEIPAVLPPLCPVSRAHCSSVRHTNAVPSSHSTRGANLQPQACGKSWSKLFSHESKLSFWTLLKNKGSTWTPLPQNSKHSPQCLYVMSQFVVKRDNIEVLDKVQFFCNLLSSIIHPEKGDEDCLMEKSPQFNNSGTPPVFIVHIDLQVQHFPSIGMKILIAGCEVKFLFCTLYLKAEKFGSFVILQMNLVLHKLIPQRDHFTIAMQNISPKTIKCGCLKNKDISLAEPGQTAFHCAAAQHRVFPIVHFHLGGNPRCTHFMFQTMRPQSLMLLEESNGVNSKNTWKKCYRKKRNDYAVVELGVTSASQRNSTVGKTKRAFRLSTREPPVSEMLPVEGTPNLRQCQEGIRELRQYITHPAGAGNAAEGVDGGEADFQGMAPPGSARAQRRSQRSRCQARVPDGFQHQLHLYTQSNKQQEALQLLLKDAAPPHPYSSLTSVSSAPRLRALKVQIQVSFFIANSNINLKPTELISIQAMTQVSHSHCFKKRKSDCKRIDRRALDVSQYLRQQFSVTTMHTTGIQMNNKPKCNSVANPLRGWGPSQISSQGAVCAAAAEPTWPIWSCSTAPATAAQSKMMASNPVAIEITSSDQKVSLSTYTENS